MTEAVNKFVKGLTAFQSCAGLDCGGTAPADVTPFAIGRAVDCMSI